MFHAFLSMAEVAVYSMHNGDYLTCSSTNYPDPELVELLVASSDNTITKKDGALYYHDNISCAVDSGAGPTTTCYNLGANPVCHHNTPPDMPGKERLRRATEHQCDVSTGECSVTKDADHFAKCPNGWQAVTVQAGIREGVRCTRDCHDYEREDCGKRLCAKSRNGCRKNPADQDYCWGALSGCKHSLPSFPMKERICTDELVNRNYAILGPECDGCIYKHKLDGMSEGMTECYLDLPKFYKFMEKVREWKENFATRIIEEHFAASLGNHGTT
jgi:hypothetical protein